MIETAFDNGWFAVLAFVAVFSWLSFGAIKPTDRLRTAVKYGTFVIEVFAYLIAFYVVGVTVYTIALGFTVGMMSYAAYRAYKWARKRFGN